MEVDVERQRIGLSLRLDDEPGQPAPKRRGDSPRGSAKSGGRGEGKRSGHKSGRGSRVARAAARVVQAAPAVVVPWPMP